MFYVLFLTDQEKHAIDVKTSTGPIVIPIANSDADVKKEENDKDSGIEPENPNGAQFEKPVPHKSDGDVEDSLDEDEIEEDIPAEAVEEAAIEEEVIEEEIEEEIEAVENKDENDINTETKTD